MMGNHKPEPEGGVRQTDNATTLTKIISGICRQWRLSATGADVITDSDYSVSISIVGVEQSDRGSTQGWMTCKGGAAAAAKLQQKQHFHAALDYCIS